MKRLSLLVLPSLLLLAACEPGTTGTPTCNASTCPGGCCDQSNTCQPGTEVDACGTGGSQCQTCGSNQECGQDTHLCQLPTTSCGPKNCATCCLGPDCNDYNPTVH